MCLYPRLILNKRYLPNKKNNYNPPKLEDNRMKYVAIACGECLECRKKKANEWQARIKEENKYQKNGKFVTFTFSDEAIYNLIEELEGDMDPNEIAKLAIRRFTERWRKENKKTCRHFFVPELGQNSTERLHLHGIIWTDKNNDYILKKWKYGFGFVGYCDERTTNYITKYITKFDIKHEDFQPKVFASKGIGKTYINNNAWKHKFNKEETREYYIDEKGKKKGLPIYWRNLLWNENERNKLWCYKLDKEERYIFGTKYDVSSTEKLMDFLKCLKTAQEFNEKLGFKPKEKWEKKSYIAINKRVNKF